MILATIFSGTSGSSIAICISPITTLMMDQVTKYNLCGLKAEYIGSTQSSFEIKRKVFNGEFQLVSVTPETIIMNCTYRNMLLTSEYKQKLVCVVAVDETHCVKLCAVLKFVSAIPPHRYNIKFKVHPKTSVEDSVTCLCEEMKAKRVNFHKT